MKNLYRLAYKMQMHSCAKACAKYLASRLDPYSCIGIRACANSSNDQLLAARVDDYIQQNFTLIHLRSQEFAALPHVKVIRFFLFSKICLKAYICIALSRLCAQPHLHANVANCSYVRAMIFSVIFFFE